MTSSTKVSSMEGKSSPPSPPICLFCLEKICEQEKCGVVTGSNFKRFLNFVRRYLNVNNVDRLLGPDLLLQNDMDEPLVLFCGGCGEEVENALKLYSELEMVRCRLLWRVGRVWEVIKCSEKRSGGQYFNRLEKWRSLADQLHLSQKSCLKVQLFRKILLRKCGLKAKRILPRVLLTKSDATASSLNDKPFVLPTRDSVQVLISLIIILSFWYGWNLETILEGYHRPPTNETKVIKRRAKKMEATVTPKRRRGKPTSKMSVPSGKHPRDYKRPSKPSNKTDSDAKCPTVLKLLEEPSLNDGKIEVDAPSPPQSIADDAFDEHDDFEPLNVEGEDDNPLPEEGNRKLRPRTEGQLAKMVEEAIDDDPEVPEKKFPPPPSPPPRHPLPPRKRGRKKIRTKPKAPKEGHQTSAPKTSSNWSAINFTVRNDLYSVASGFFMKCPDCPSRFVTLLPYQSHLQLVHQKGPPLEPSSCTVCDKTFDNLASLFSHLQSQHEETGGDGGGDSDKPYVCVYCPESFKISQTCDLHRKNNHWLLPEDLHCDLDHCPSKFFSPADLQDHHLTCHPDSETVSCDKCHWSFLNPSRLALHALTHIPKNPSTGSYHCDKCHHKFPTPFSLTSHYNKQELPKKQKLFPCRTVSDCPFILLTDKQLSAHIDKHSLCCKVKLKSHRTLRRPPEGKQFPCLYCPLNFPIQMDRESHESSCPSGPSLDKRLASDKRYVCGKCDYAINHRNDMTRHQQGAHGNAAFQCPQCPSRFNRKDHLKVHEIRMHQKSSHPICHICGKSFANMPELRYHVKGHDAPHMCPECGKRCSRGWLLKMHMRSHSGERMMCEWCPKIFRIVGDIKVHVREEHPEEFQRYYGGVVKRRIKYRLVRKDEIIGEGSGGGGIRVKYGLYNQQLGMRMEGGSQPPEVVTSGQDEGAGDVEGDANFREDDGLFKWEDLQVKGQPSASTSSADHVSF